MVVLERQGREHVRAKRMVGLLERDRHVEHRLESLAHEQLAFLAADEHGNRARLERLDGFRWLGRLRRCRIWGRGGRLIRSLHGEGRFGFIRRSWDALGRVGIGGRFRLGRELEQARVLDRLRRKRCTCHDDARAQLRQAPQLPGEGPGKSDAAVRGRVVRDHALVHRHPGPGDPLHVIHGRVAVDVGMMPAILLDDAENPLRSGVTGRTG